MQTQPGTGAPRAIDKRRARQAAQLPEDAFKGGEAYRPAGPRALSSPWHRGPGHLWKGADRRDGKPAN